MRALSLWQPWASAIALGLKAIETRGWPTNYRGPLAIHAAKRWTREERDFLAERQDASRYPRHVRTFPKNIEIPLGAIVAVVNLDDCRHTRDLLPTIDDLEMLWGNYTAGRYGFVLSNIRPLPQPIPFKGAQGFFNVPDDLIAAGLPIQPSANIQGSLL